MKPRDVTDAMLEAYDKTLTGKPGARLNNLHDMARVRLAAAINAMPTAPELARLQAENKALREVLRQISEVEITIYAGRDLLYWRDKARSMLAAAPKWEGE